MKFWSVAKGYGFIVAENGQEVFVHATSLRDTPELIPDQEVQFQVKQTHRGPAAICVTLVQES